jgi:hypothetical protein
MVVFLAFWSLHGPHVPWCLAGNGLELVSSSHLILPNARQAKRRDRCCPASGALSLFRPRLLTSSLSSLAALDLQQARDWFDDREEGLGDRFLAKVEDALDRISKNAEQYQGGTTRSSSCAREGIPALDLVSGAARREHRRSGAVGPPGSDRGTGRRAVKPIEPS